jgi:hypothetical protein
MIHSFKESVLTYSLFIDVLAVVSCVIVSDLVFPLTYRDSVISLGLDHWSFF